jgi:hypothetical protein
MKWTWEHTIASLLFVLTFAPLFLGLTGCAFGGAKENNVVILCEPGAVVEVATDKAIDVIATTDDGKKAVCQKNIAGCVAMPKSVYRQMREAWIAAHPEGK